MQKYLIQEKYDVDEPESRKEFVSGETRDDYADPWQSTGNIILVGLAGSGKSALAQLLSQKTPLECVAPQSIPALLSVMQEKSQIIVVDDLLVEDMEVQNALHGAGKVFYLMADSKTLTSRIVKEDVECDFDVIWEKTSERLTTLEPVFYRVLHFILDVSNGHDSVLEDALEKIAF